MDKYNITIEQGTRKQRVPTIENCEILDLEDKKWYGNFDSDELFKIGQEINLNLGNYHGKAIITGIDSNKKTYYYIGNGKLNII